MTIRSIRSIVFTVMVSACRRRQRRITSLSNGIKMAYQDRKLRMYGSIGATTVSAIHRTGRAAGRVEMNNLPFVR